MKITTTENKIIIEDKNYKNTYPLNSLSYQITTDGISIFQSCRRVATAPIPATTVDGKQITLQNADELLNQLFANSDKNNLSLPIEINDVNGLQNSLNTIPSIVMLTKEEFNALVTKDSNTFYYVY